MKHFLLSLVLLTTVLAHSQTGSVTGKLTDKDYNNEPLAFANVIIKGTTKGTTSDFDGLYTISGLEPGNYTVVFSFVGYEKQEIPVTITAGNATKLNVGMAASAASLDEIVIKTTRKKVTEAATLSDQKKAVEIKQTIGAVELAKKGVSDAAGAVAKISGVSKQEGSSNVYVRGLSDRYLNTTLNGLSLPSNDVSKKNIDLNLFSSDIIENVSISKAYSSKFYADFAAGNVDITSKDYTGDGFFEFSVGSSINTNAIDQDFIRSEGTGYFGFYNRFSQEPFAVILNHGVDPVDAGAPINVSFGGSFGKSFDFKNGSKLSFYGTGSFENSFEYRRGVSVDFTNVEDKAFDDAEEFEYGTTTTAMASIIYKIDSNSTIKANSLFINSSSDKVGFFGIDGTGRNRDAIQDTDQGFFQQNIQFNENLIYVNQLTGKHKFETLDLDWGFGHNFVNANEPDRKRFSFENFQFALDDDPNTNPEFFSNVDFDNQRYFQNIQDEEFNGRLNLTVKTIEDVKINIGYNGRSKERNFDNTRFGLDIIGDPTVPDVNNLNDFFAFNNLDTDVSPGGFRISVNRPIPGQSNINRPGLDENTYDGQLDIHAGYINAQINLDDKWLIVPGFRVESFDQTVSYDVINLGSNGVDTVSDSDGLFLPSLSVKYALQEDQNLRFSASRTISLPEFKEVAPFVYESVSQRIGGNPDLFGRGDNTTFINVPDVSFSNVINLDLKYEWFFSPLELFAVSTFYKQIDDPVNLVVAFDATGTQRFFRTGERAQVFGAEIDFRKNLILNEDDDPKLSFGINATIMHTEQDLYDNIVGTFNVSFSEDEEQLQGASPFVGNADITYAPTISENFKPSATLSSSYFSDRIDALGSGTLGNVIEKGIPSLDFVLRNKIGEKFQANFAVKNILNPRVRYIRESADGDILVTSANGKDVTNYRKGLNIGLQLKYEF